jgi:hypothetical protein
MHEGPIEPECDDALTLQGCSNRDPAAIYAKLTQFGKRSGKA